ncbi:serpentine receptor class gamma-16 [Biomphalaria glabrata]
MVNNTSPGIMCFNNNITDEIAELVITVNYFILNTIIGFTGLVVNVIKVIVFFKLGLNDSTNISFFVLSLADTGIGILMVGFSTVFNPLFKQAVMYIDVAVSIAYYCVAWPYGFFSRVASLMTAVITVERFLCVTFPLKVKEIFNPTVAATISIILILSVLVSVIPAFVATRLGPVFNDKLNLTLLGLVQTESRAQLESVSFLCVAIFQIVSIGVITSFTIALTHTFLQTTKWRNQVSNKSEQLSTKHKRLVKMVIFMSISFLIFSIPSMIFIFLAVFQEGFTNDGPCKNVFYLVSSFIFPTDAINSIISFVLLLHMSSKFKHIFRLMLFGTKRLKKH